MVFQDVWSRLRVGFIVKKVCAEILTGVGNEVVCLPTVYHYVGRKIVKLAQMSIQSRSNHFSPLTVFSRSRPTLSTLGSRVHRPFIDPPPNLSPHSLYLLLVIPNRLAVRPARIPYRASLLSVLLSLPGEVVAFLLDVVLQVDF